MAGKKSSHNIPRQCLLHHNPFHSFALLSRHTAISRQTQQTPQINLQYLKYCLCFQTKKFKHFQKISSFAHCIMCFPLKAIADHESKWVRIIFHRTVVHFKLHSETGTLLYQLFHFCSHIPSAVVIKQRAKQG